MNSRSDLIGCRTCGGVAGMPRTRSIGGRGDLRCPHCHSRLTAELAGSSSKVRDRTAALALAALVLFPPAVLLPVMRVEQLGHAHETGILRGAADLITDGHGWLGLIVLVCSVVVPILKLSGLLLLSTTKIRTTPATRAVVWRLVERAGRWGMLDVLLVAAVVAMIKIGDLVSIEPGAGALIFAGVVVLSLLASMSFDPRLVRVEESP